MKESTIPSTLVPSFCRFSMETYTKVTNKIKRNIYKFQFLSDIVTEIIKDVYNWRIHLTFRTLNIEIC